MLTLSPFVLFFEPNIQSTLILFGPSEDWMRQLISLDWTGTPNHAVYLKVRTFPNVSVRVEIRDTIRYSTDVRIVWSVSVYQPLATIPGAMTISLVQMVCH